MAMTNTGFVTLAILCCLPLFVHGQSGLNCIAGSTVMTLSFNSTDDPPSEACPAGEDFGCLRVDASATFTNSRDEIEEASTAFGQCVSEEACQNTCSEAVRTLIFDEINSVIQLDSSTLSVGDCAAACCTTDNCNSVSVAELEALRGGATSITSSAVTFMAAASSMLLASRLF